MKKTIAILSSFVVSTFFLCAEQTINYPADEPIFSIGFPDDWKVKTGESVSASSADQLVNMELIALEADELDEALDAAKQALAEEMEGIKWNGKPEKGEMNGMEVRFLNAKVTVEDVDMAVNCAVFVPKGKDTFFMLFNIVPMESLEKHGESIGKILNSVKAK